MKTTVNILILTILSTVAISCNSDMYVPSDAIKSTFKSMYPKAKFVDWEFEAGYVNAEFSDDGKRKDAWFDTDANYLMTETDIKTSKVPAAIKATLSKGEYAKWRIDDVDYLEFATAAPMYVLDIENGDQDVDLYFSPDGELLEVRKDDDLPHHLPKK